MQDATDDKISNYTEAVRNRVAQQVEAARAAETRYRQTLQQQYTNYPVHDGARDGQLRALTPGEFVVIRRERQHHFGVQARGPYVVQAQEGLVVRVLDLASGRVQVEARSNCRPILLGLEAGPAAVEGRV